MATLMSNNGYFIPLMSPIIVPDHDPVSEPDRVILFHSDWTPAILACLKTLARPETYVASEEKQPFEGMQDGHQIIAAIDKYPTTLPSWDVNFGMDGDYEIILSSVTGEINTGRYHRGVAIKIGEESAGAINLSLTGFLVSDFTSAGGKMVIDVYHAPDAAKAFVISGINCNGSFIAESGFTSSGHLHREYPSAKTVSITIDALNAMYAEVIINTEPVCIET